MWKVEFTTLEGEITITSTKFEIRTAESFLKDFVYIIDKSKNYEFKLPHDRFKKLTLTLLDEKEE